MAMLRVKYLHLRIGQVVYPGLRRRFKELCVLARIFANGVIVVRRTDLDSHRQGRRRRHLAQIHGHAGELGDLLAPYVKHPLGKV